MVTQRKCIDGTLPMSTKAYTFIDTFLLEKNSYLIYKAPSLGILQLITIPAPYHYTSGLQINKILERKIVLYFLIHQFKRMLWVLKRTVSLRRFF